MTRSVVPILFGKVVMACQHYDGHVNGKMFSEFVKKHFPEMLYCESMFVASNFCKMETHLKTVNCRRYIG